MQAVLADEADAAFDRAASNREAALPALRVVEHEPALLEACQLQSHVLRPLLPACLAAHCGPGLAFDFETAAKAARTIA
jgi:hypothetical protein